MSNKNSFIFGSVEKGKIRGRYTIIGFNPDKIYNIKNNKIIWMTLKEKIIKEDTLKFLNNLFQNFKVKSTEIYLKCHQCLWDIFRTI